MNFSLYIELIFQKSNLHPATISLFVKVQTHHVVGVGSRIVCSDSLLLIDHTRIERSSLADANCSGEIIVRL
jgi:hypothetical protein